MNSKSLARWMRVAIVITGACGLALCVLWPLISFSIIEANFIGAIAACNYPIQTWIMIVFFWLTGIPTAYILVQAWIVSIAVKKDEFFTKKTARIIRRCAKILLIDLAAFLVGNIVFLILAINTFVLLHFALIVGGLILAIFMLIFSQYVLKAAILKEENDATI